MSARDTLTPELRAEVLRLEDDLRARVASLPDVQSAWREEYDAARAAERTAAAWEAWVDERVTLAAVAWVLTTVFIRFCEDNALVKPVWISGPRIREAIDAQQQFLRETARTNADVTDREWLLRAVEHLKALPATAGLVEDTSPMWLVMPSGDAATRLLNFWRERDENGALIRDLSDPDLDTRFLGDLYQDISEDAKKRYALLQTPVFVEEFILDRTLEPALNERPLEGFKMIDPTCGSGHFLLGGFSRLLDRWHKHAPGLDERERVQAALDSVYGVDINPFAVAIARFRLTVAALRACGLLSLEDAPSFKYHLAAGDTLLHGTGQHEFEASEPNEKSSAESFMYRTERIERLNEILRRSAYDAVVGNPPYIQVADPALNRAYRQLYPTCHRKYGLTVPFMERFFQLAKGGPIPGRIGKITGSAFMTRVFGEKLVNDFMSRVQVDQVVDTKNLNLAGHGTPTIILFGRATRNLGASVGAVVCTAAGTGETRADSPIWLDLRDCAIAEGEGSFRHAEYVRAPVRELWSHPVVLMTDQERQVMKILEASGRTLDRVAASPGLSFVTGEEEAFKRPISWMRTRPNLRSHLRPLADGAVVRDWSVGTTESALVYPYDDSGQPAASSALMKELWPLRRVLAETKYFGKDKAQRGLRWFEYAFFSSERQGSSRLIYPLVTDNAHFAFGQGHLLVDHSAPVAAIGPDSVGHLMVLNASVTWFFMKRTFFAKGHDDPEFDFHEIDATKAKRIPLPRHSPQRRTVERLMRCVAERAKAVPTNVSVPTIEKLEQSRQKLAEIHEDMVALQEELDWDAYRLYGLVDEDLTYAGDDLPPLSPGERAFELLLARRQLEGESTTWFQRSGAVALKEPPSTWPFVYRQLVDRRIAAIERSPLLQLLEHPQHKRRWVKDEWGPAVRVVVRSWLLDHLEEPELWMDQYGRPTPQSVAVLADKVARQVEFIAVLSLLEGRRDVDVAAAIQRLLLDEAVPFAAAYRYKEAGLRKRAVWDATWVLQRREDAGTYDSRPKEHGGDGPIPVPPKYNDKDFVRKEYWSLRGKLDVPKERFILYPGAGREGDPSPVLGWAGWDHAQQALAVATLIQSGEQQGWSEDRLIPLVAGLSELLPWVEQWHSEPDALYGGSSPAEFFSGLLDNYMAKLGATPESLAAWRPPAPTRGRKAKT